MRTNWHLIRLGPGDSFPPVDRALPAQAPYPGLLAVGGRVDASTLEQAYARGIFPWFQPGDAPLWWSLDPRMVLVPAELRVRRSLRQAARRFADDPRYQLRIDADFRGTMLDCAAPRRDASDTWIGPEIVEAYVGLHLRGLAHSFELWHDAQRVAGLYVVNLGGMVYGESMFSRVTDGSKLLVMALCGFCLRWNLGPIDCQQQTDHLASLGARPWPREVFLQALEHARERVVGAQWTYDWAQWRHDCKAWL